MNNVVIEVNNLSKQYRLGKVGRKTLRHDVNRWLHNLLGKEDPYAKIGEENDRSVKGNSEYVWALQDVNFKVEQGDVLGVIGKNGAGKSTLLKILSKVTAPTTGEIKVRGRIASLLEVGTGFHPELSGRDNIFLNGAILGMTRREIQGKFDEIVDFAGVERYIDTPVKRYSSGMYVRLAFAVAAHLEPDILIVDEVLAVGDAEFQKKCLGKMKDVSEREGRTVLFVSHNMPATLKLCTRAMVLQWGKIVFAGNAEEGIDFYLNHERINCSENLLERTDRSGNGRIQCSAVTFCNQESIPVKAVKSGDELNIQVDFILRETPVKLVYFRIQIVGSDEQIIFTCNNEHSSALFPVISESGRVICTIPKLPLFAGTYYINLQIYSREAGLLDEIMLAKEFDVENGDFFGTGKIPFVKKGVIVNHNWQFPVQR